MEALWKVGMLVAALLVQRGATQSGYKCPASRYRGGSAPRCRNGPTGPSDPAILCCEDSARWHGLGRSPAFAPYCYSARNCAQAAKGCLRSSGCDTHFELITCPEQQNGNGPSTEELLCFVSKDLFCRSYVYWNGNFLEVTKIIPKDGYFTMSDTPPAPWCGPASSANPAVPSAAKPPPPCSCDLQNTGRSNQAGDITGGHLHAKPVACPVNKCCGGNTLGPGQHCCGGSQVCANDEICCTKTYGTMRPFTCKMKNDTGLLTCPEGGKQHACFQGKLPTAALSLCGGTYVNGQPRPKQTWFVQSQAPKMSQPTAVDFPAICSLNNLNKKVLNVATNYYNRSHNASHCPKGQAPCLPAKYAAATKADSIALIAKDFEWTDAKLAQLWQAASDVSRAKGFVIDPHILLAVILQEGTGSFNTNKSPNSKDFGGGAQPDFEKDLKAALEIVVVPKIVAYAFYAKEYQAAAQAAVAKGDVFKAGNGALFTYAGTGDLFEYINHQTTRIHTNSVVHCVVYAAHFGWHTGITKKFDGMVGTCGAAEYAKYVLEVFQGGSLRWPQNVNGGHPVQQKFEVKPWGTDSSGLIGGYPVLVDTQHCAAPKAKKPKPMKTPAKQSSAKPPPAHG